MALEPGRMFTRDYLTDLLWHTAAPRLANHSLAQGLSVIKAKVAREAVLIQRATVGVAPGWVDVDAQHLTNGDATIAGPFLDGFDIQAARPFEEWKEEYRAHLLPQLRDCLVRQMDAARRVGDFATVERRAERLHELDPLAEEAVRGIMEARAWAGDRSNALKAFARFEAQLAEELDAKPSADLCRVADLLRDGRRPTPRAGGGEAPAERVERRFEPETLIGREREFSFLYDAWLDARRKHPRIVVVTSDPGVGKTTLANAFVSSCQMDGAVVARAQAYDAERELPFAVLGELVRQLASQRAIGGADPEALSELTRISSEILRVFPGVPKPVEWSPELTPLRIADAFLKTVTAAAEDSPVVLIVDDIHAADNASTAILHVVARKLADARVMMILAGRTSELRLSEAPASFASDDSIIGLQPLELDILAREPATRLVYQLALSERTESPPIDRILKASGGNPLAIELLTREWASHGPSSLLADLEALDTHPLPMVGIPPAIRAVFERQSRRLHPKTRAALDLAAVVGRRLTDLALYRAVDLTPALAGEALSRLREEGLLRDVRGDLEFRNELIRAQAYYAIAGPTRAHLHHSIGNLLSARPLQSDPAVKLEIAWHFLRAGDPSTAVMFAMDGSEAFLGVGAPHGAEEILGAIIDLEIPLEHVNRVRILLARALLDQSKAQQALPIIDKLLDTKGLSLHDKADVAMIRASAEFALNREPGTTYCEVAGIALDAAKRTGDASLISKALFECARAGTEEGLTDLVKATASEAEVLSQDSSIASLPMTVLTRAFCRFFLGEAENALIDLERVEEVSPSNAAQLSLIKSGIGITNYFLGRLQAAHDAYRESLELVKRIGDDARVSMVTANLCMLQMNRGYYEESIEYGRMSVQFGESSDSSTLLLSYTNLMDPYVLLGREADAIECLDKAKRWLRPERRWKLHCVFLVEAASFALIQRNESLAIDLVTQLESLARGREDAVPMPGPYWKLRAFKTAQLGHVDEAYSMVQSLGDRWKKSAPVNYLDMIASKAWLEGRQYGRICDDTLTELQTFNRIGATGRKALMVAQGFLSPE
jgi:tetratricopeptide (TPR) repeat protein